MRSIIVFDAVKQLELNVFCDLMYEMVKDVKTQGELEEMLQVEITEKELQRINEAALYDGFQPLSFLSDKRKEVQPIKHIYF